jgi:hypothetical protein
VNDKLPIEVRLEVLGDNLPQFLGNRDYFAQTVHEAAAQIRSLKAEKEFLSAKVREMSVESRITKAENTIMRLRIENPSPKIDER